jgi:hypothetical protein
MAASRGEYDSRICYEPKRCAAYFPFCLPNGSKPAFKHPPTDKESVKGACCNAMLRHWLAIRDLNNTGNGPTYNSTRP